MTTFYEGLRRGLPKDEALRQAQLRFVRGDVPDPQWRLPKFWAAFVLSGDWRPLLGP